ncbi:IncI1 plasmid conjugative transfer protein TraH [Acinetobacter junii CIP 107470 = MTCC 11364]|uniref:IncI1 plasmid conjugative transfer protein TraH n=1 Tax=Acinetobacter junii CIP 107470 = MTCC 11364 TaxID=1217666 RepID=S7WKV1_ACIJU|nr:DotD/TraH family lipoprotein [Acinetobacter junii]ENV52439.1 hypothetical protein F953_00134 [Acinetobacter junii CIP 107470 = MTCC 11364]EPR82487.1 IncI1 plasmid conjugative transfer protein TraH [Acinetobacter junii CIP 107470 = MTCC 11364]
MSKKILLCVGFAALLQGCATTQKNTDQVNIDQEILNATHKIMRAQATLYNASALNNARMTLPYWIDGDQPVTVTWYGDAQELFTSFAKARNKQFVETGVKQPLPVALDVRDTKYSTIITLLQSQLGYRATIIEDETTIKLQYNPPKTNS